MCVHALVFVCVCVCVCVQPETVIKCFKAQMIQQLPSLVLSPSLSLSFSSLRPPPPTHRWHYTLTLEPSQLLSCLFVLMLKLIFSSVVLVHRKESDSLCCVGRKIRKRGVIVAKERGQEAKKQSMMKQNESINLLFSQTCQQNALIQ